MNGSDFDELRSILRMAKHMTAWIEDVVDGESEVLEAAEVLKFTLYRALCDANGGMPPSLSVSCEALRH